MSRKADMYYLRQRRDFQEKFNLPVDDDDDGGQDVTSTAEGEQDNKPWRRQKDQAQTDAEIAQRAAQLAAAARGAGVNGSAPPPQPAVGSQDDSKSRWSVRWKW